MWFARRLCTVISTQNKFCLEAILRKQEAGEFLTGKEENLLAAIKNVELCFRDLHQPNTLENVRSPDGVKRAPSE